MNTATGLWKAGQSKNCAYGPCNSPAHPSLSHMPPGVEGAGCWKLGFGEWTQGGQRLAVKRQPAGTGVRSSTTGKVFGRNPGCYRSKVSLLSGTQGAEPPLQLPSPLAGPCLHGPWEGLPPERACPSLLQLPASLCHHRHFTRPSCGCLIPPQPE